ncbi:hypothetical protein NQ317_002016 [Molorchus minor]|uniref:endo-polygalacturonase n=1 Tax=Molorchus minor TaxID=1323400 RepID=A0ABQ9IQD7_9CUCU|nr:hypothetical protein NQ317_002016 [Molorchus minor]
MVNRNLSLMLVVPLIISASILKEDKPRASCTVTSFDQLDAAIATCSDIVISGVEVPAGQQLDLNLNNDTRISFDGHITFAYADWDGPLIHIKGHNVTVEGTEGHILDGQGELWWDGLGGHGNNTKPKLLEDLWLRNIHLLNCPISCVGISSTDLTVDGWTIDCSEGNKADGGKNTDGFGVKDGSNVVIKNSIVKNQDDCIVVNYGYNYYFSNISCWGSHGLSLSVGQSQAFELNTVSNITFIDSYVADSENGIHVKTHADGGQGIIKDVTYENIELSGGQEL